MSLPRRKEGHKETTREREKEKKKKKNTTPLARARRTFEFNREELIFFTEKKFTFLFQCTVEYCVSVNFRVTGSQLHHRQKKIGIFN